MSTAPSVASTGRFATPVRILYMIDEMEAITAGGTERQILQMISLMRRSGADMQLCVLRGTGWLTEEQAGCSVKFFNLRRVASLQGMRELVKIYRWLRSQRFDIVQTFFIESGIVGPILARLARVPIIIGTRRNLNWWLNGKAVLAQRFSNRFTTRLLANCDAVKSAVIKTEQASPATVDVIHNGVDTDWFTPDAQLRTETRAVLGLSDAHVVVGSTATLRPGKGIEAFIKAAESVHRAAPSTRFLLVGDGPLRAQAEWMISNLRLGGVCLLVGSQEDVRPYLNAMDVGVLCSQSEGFSNSILEFLAAGLPCIATDVGGNREAVGPAGRLVPSDSVEALAREMTALAGDPALRKALCLAALEQARLFSMERARISLCRYYEGLLPR